ncbi:MAG: hypothetical protein WC755_07390, partial [Candidatus Woesearchaeota archaeon]
ISIINSKTGIPTNAIVEDFEVYEKNHSIIENTNLQKNIIVSKDEFTSRRDSLEKRLFGIIFLQDKNDIGINKENVFVLLKEKIGEEEFNKMYEAHLPFGDLLALDIERLYGNNINDINRHLDELVLNLEGEILGERLYLLRDKINQQSNSNEDFDPGPILKDIQKIGERLEIIKSNRSQ